MFGTGTKITSMDTLMLGSLLTALLLALPMGGIKNHLPVPAPPINVFVQVLLKRSACSWHLL